MNNIDPTQLNEEFIRMQKLAGIITETEYTKIIKENTLKCLSERISTKCAAIKQSLKEQGYI
jgi:hypothetical protein